MNKLILSILCVSFISKSNISHACNITNPDAVVAINNQKICSTSPSPFLKGLASPTPGETTSWSVPAGSLNTVTASGQTDKLQAGANRFIYTITSSTEAAPCNIDTALVTIVVEQEPDVAIAGPAFSTCALNYQLRATPVTNGTGTWTPTGSVITANSPNGIATLKKNQANTFQWTVSNGAGSLCPDKTSTVTIIQEGEVTSPKPVSAQSKTISINDPAPLLNTTGISTLKSYEIGEWSALAPAKITSSGQTSDLIVGKNTFNYSIISAYPGCSPSIGTVIITVTNITGLEEELPLSQKKLIRILTPLGQELQPEQATEGLFIYQYSDGSTRKVMKQN